MLDELMKKLLMCTLSLIIRIYEEKARGASIPGVVFLVIFA
jgi:hypothetical protein